jgi:hypothetical protein
MLVRNFKTFYNRKSSKSGKTVISMYPDSSVFPVYEISEWWADDWDALDYSRDVDFTRPFFEQMGELLNSVPHMNMINNKSNGCEYSNIVYGCNNCYLACGAIDAETCDYGHVLWNSRDSVDNLYLFKSEYCYECINCISCNSLHYSQDCESCADSIALYNCRSCTNCIGCVGLRQKSYHIFNQPVTKEEYETFKKKYPLADKESISYILTKVEELKKTNPEPHMIGSRYTASSGNYIYNAHNVQYSFDIKSGESSKFGANVRSFVSSYDCSFTSNVENCYQVFFSLGTNLIGCHGVRDSSFVSYSDTCFGCDNLFGCVGLRQKKYCILNKQYTKEEYEILVPKIIELMKKHNEYGQFFAPAILPFAYNESTTCEYMPMEKNEALALGFRWKDDLPKTIGQGTMTFDALPKSSEFYDETLLSEVFTCDECQRNFRLIDRELTFYRRFNLSIPHKCFQCRHRSRMDKRYPRILHTDTCDCCKKNIQTSVPMFIRKDRVVYCEDCYKREVL